MRILAIDYGTRRLGLALSDPMGITAQPLISLLRKSIAKDIAELRRIVEEYEVERGVIGLPRNLDGSPGALWQESEDFRRRLESEFGIEVEGWDERLSTVQAERMLIRADVSRRKRKGVIDKVAAALILQSYLDARSASAGSGSSA
ncbi:MAG TPA: Holliday junction resolvase RuvX [Acidobacteriota bacterium]|nr:Holliday junction resolvase RuvX [Acidobacteriota bacterium]